MLVPAVSVTVPFLVSPLIVLALPRAGASLRALAAAASTSALLAVYAALLLVAGLPRPPLWPASAWRVSVLLVVVTFWALSVSARRALKAAGPGRASAGWLPALGLSVVCFLTGSLFAFAMLGHWARQTANETATVALLRTIGRAEASARRKCGYTETLATLDVGDADLAAKMREGPTFLKNSYTVEYRPGRPVPSTAPGCSPGVESFVVTARPLAWGVDGRSSFFMDGTEAIHYTSSDRPANAGDPMVSR